MVGVFSILISKFLLLAIVYKENPPNGDFYDCTNLHHFVPCLSFIIG